METNTGGNAPQTQAAKKDARWKVYDMNQRGKDSRKHEVIVKLERAEDGTITHVDTVSYDLRSDKFCLMTADHALRFLTDPAFKVMSPDDVRIMPVPKRDATKPVQHLAHDEVVVKFNELSKDALLRRVKVLPGSEEVSTQASTEELAAFLTEFNKSKAGLTEGQRALAEMLQAGGMDAMPAAMAGKLLPDSSMVAGQRQAA